MTEFTPVQSLVGGLLIGLSTLLMIRWLGKIAGISGIIGQLWTGSKQDKLWRWAFAIGLVLSPIVYQLFATLPQIKVPSSPWQLMIAGFLVGFGSRLGSGCTSGHGVCGLSRLSTRSLVATLAFMITAMIVVGLMRHLFA